MDSACEHEYPAATPQGRLPHRRPRANRHSGDSVLDSVGFEPIGETTAKEKTKSRRKNEPDLAALARRATGSICWGGGGLGDGSGRSWPRKKRDQEGGGGTQAWRGKEATKFPRPRGKSSAGDAQPNTRAERCACGPEKCQLAKNANLVSQTVGGRAGPEDLGARRTQNIGALLTVATLQKKNGSNNIMKYCIYVHFYILL